MKKTILPYSRQWIQNDDIQSVIRVLKSDWITQGPNIDLFEQSLAKACGAQYAVAVANGTAALHIAALCCDLDQRHEVITSPISFLATSNSILYAGAKPVFSDIDLETYCINPNLIESKITPKTKAIFVTDFAGHPADLKKIFSIAKKYSLFVVEDAAHALGARYLGEPVGNCRYSDVTILSFHPVKHITTGEGGAILTNNKTIYETAKAFRSHGVTKEPNKLLKKNVGGWYYEMHQLGFNYRLTDIQAALGISQLKKLSRFVEKRRTVASLYHRYLNSIEELALPSEKKYAYHSYHLYPIRITTNNPTEDRRKIYDTLHANGIGAQIHYIPISVQPYYKKMGYQSKNTPCAESYYASEISIPIYPQLKNSDVKKISKIIIRAIRNLGTHRKVKGANYAN